ncbi:MAG TPA: 2-dehydropantoate 2-reductase [Gaiellales bacterium]|jgi:2-dehydropantoate 2-reductase
MRFAVLGAGAIGGYVGAALSRGGADVTLIARGAQLEALRRNGVRVLSERGDFAAHPAATDEIEAVADADVVFVALKAYSLPGVAARLGASLRPGAVTIWAQNGMPWWFFQSHRGPLEDRVLESVDPGGGIARAIPRESVLGTVVYCASELVEPGVIRHVEGTRFTLGEPDGSLSARAAEIAAAFVAGGMKSPVEPRIRDHIFLKLLGNVAFNPVSALTGATLGRLGERDEMRHLLMEMFLECAAVAERLGIEIPVSLERRLEGGFAVGDHKTSMLQDLEAGKPLELDCMTGAIVELAGILEIAVPHTETVHACARMLDRSSLRV